MLSRSIGWKPNAHTGLPLPGVGTSAPPSLGTADHSSIGSTRRLPESWPSARHSSQLGACCQTTTTPSVSFSPQCNIHRVAPSHLRRRDARVSKPQRRDIPTDFPVYIAREVGEAVIVPSVRQLRSQSNASRTFYQEAPRGVWRAELTATQHYSVPTCPCSGTTTMFWVKSKPCEIFGQVGLPPPSHADRVP